jgi:hypothetical protein
MKKRIYLMVTMIFLMVLAYFIYQLTIIVFSQKTSYIFAIVVISIIGGSSLGKLWWQIVYIERKHWKFKKKDESVSQSASGKC